MKLWILFCLHTIFLWNGIKTVYKYCSIIFVKSIQFGLFLICFLFHVFTSISEVNSKIFFSYNVFLSETTAIKLKWISSVLYLLKNKTFIKLKSWTDRFSSILMLYKQMHLQCFLHTLDNEYFFVVVLMKSCPFYPLKFKHRNCKHK